MECKKCKKSFSANEIDTDGFCFTCANDDPYYNPDHTAAVKEILENAMNTLAAAKKVSPTKIKTDLVAEHAYKNPEKYIKEVVSQVKPKKNGSALN